MFGTLVPRIERLPRPLVRFEREMENLMDRVFNPDDGRWLVGFVPAANVAETETGYEVSLELPGMKPEEPGHFLRASVRIGAPGSAARFELFGFRAFCLPPSFGARRAYRRSGFPA